MTRSEKHAKIFNSTAELYDKVRPGYPDEIVEKMLSFASIRSGSRALEIGCGTGQLTVPLAERGLSITALDRGPALAEIAARKCRKFPEVRIVNTTFEEWECEPGSFDLVASAQAFHWIDPDYGIPRAAELLNPTGALALIWNLQDRSRDTDFWKATNPIYDKYLPISKTGSYPLAKSVETYREALESSELFEKPAEFRKAWSRRYSHDEYIMLLHTFSDHVSLTARRRNAFFSEISRVIMDMGGEVERLLETIVIVAKRDWMVNAISVL
ncbi:MAG: class I SAM-dependent methyltransferase [Candidatus Hatepunaea meridiana]|nr:class I SAM-dependent methyltransferase [Candidatus Hatepunaea meridiana]